MKTITKEYIVKLYTNAGSCSRLMRLKDLEQQLTLAQEVQAKGLSVHETRQRVRELLGKEFKWRLVPVS
jgi:hypothetical protein